MPLSYQPTYHLNAFTNVVLYMIPMDPRSIASAHWGLVPHWVTTHPKTFLAKYATTLNARSETLFENASFELVARIERGLVLLDGTFYH
jgi:putative SOS response-associated peptidase YedK